MPAAPSVNQSFQVQQATQTITFGSLGNMAYGTATFNLSATASSGLTVSFASLTTTVCTVSGVQVTLVMAGTCTIQATQNGNTNYSAAPSVNQSFQVQQATQTITFGSLSNMPYGTAPFNLSAASSSGLAVSYASLTTTACTVSGVQVTLVMAGTCTIQATQNGNTNYAAAPSVNQSFQVQQAMQTILFGSLSDQYLGAPPFGINATASSGLPVTFTASTPACSVSGAQVNLLALGMCSIQATQLGNTNYSAAMPVTQSFNVTQPVPTIYTGTSYSTPSSFANAAGLLRSVDFADPPSSQGPYLSPTSTYDMEFSGVCFENVFKADPSVYTYPNSTLRVDLPPGTYAMGAELEFYYPTTGTFTVTLFDRTSLSIHQ